MSGYDLHPLREKCHDCGGVNGSIRMTNGQAIVRCSRCGRHLYNAPRSEMAACLASPFPCAQCKAARDGELAPDSPTQQQELAL